MHRQKATIRGIASYLPEKILTNFDLEKMVETSDEWIVSRTGIQERRIAAKDEFTSDLASKAAIKLIKKLNIDPKSISLIIVATTTPDHICPNTASLVQNKIGASNSAAVDIQAACTGFIYGLSMAKAFIESKTFDRILLIAAEKLTSYIDYQDRNTCVIFSDGAAAALIEAGGKGLEVETLSLGADGDNASLIRIDAGGTKLPACEETVKNRQHFIKMEGKEVFKHAVRRMTASSQKCLGELNLQESDIRWIIPHQANVRIMDAIAKALSIEPERIYRTIHKYGNNSAPSVAIALDELQQEFPLKPKEHVLLTAFGAGLTWGTVILKQT